MTDGLYLNDYGITHLARSLISEISNVCKIADLENITNSSRSTCDQPQTGEVSLLIYNMTTNEGNTSSFSELTSCDLSERLTKLENV